MMPKGFLPSEDRAGFTVSTEATQGIGFEEMVAHQHGGGRDPRRRIRTSRSSATTSASAGRAAAAAARTPAASSSMLKPRARARAVGRPGDRQPAAEAGADSRRPRVPGQPAADQHRRPRRRAACTSSRCRTPTPTSSTSWAPMLEAKMRELPGLRGRQQRPAAQEPAGQRRPRPRPDRRRSG